MLRVGDRLENSKGKRFYITELQAGCVIFKDSAGKEYAEYYHEIYNNYYIEVVE